MGTLIRRTNPDGKTEEKEIFEINDERAVDYDLLGKAVGINLQHCFSLGDAHKEKFWDRVYGYRIIEDDDSKMFAEAMVKASKGTKMISVCFYEKKPEVLTGYIPFHLEIPQRPELNHFPLNIVFSSTHTGVTNIAIYQPDLSTYSQNADEQRMKYYNVLDRTRTYYVEIVYDKHKDSYAGFKYRNDEQISSAFGSKWRDFFAHLTLFGVTPSDLDK